MDAIASPWWLDTTWLRHRYTIKTVHPLLQQLERTRGSAFVTTDRVLELLDARRPTTLVREWIDQASGRRMGFPLGLPVRTCRWREGNESCGQPVSAINAKYCGVHAPLAAKARYRRYNGKRAPGNHKVTALGAL